jgi:hypothetical protein
MIPRWSIFVIFVVALLGVSLEMPHKSQEAGYLAARNLPMNTRVNSTLWIFQKGETPVASWRAPKPEDLTGKYLKSDIKEGSAITLTNLSESPKLTFSSDSAPFTFNLGDLGPLGAYLNAGAKVYVCDQETLLCAGGPHEVKAVLGKVDVQLALICLTGKEADDVRKIKKPTLRIAVFP